MKRQLVDQLTTDGIPHSVALKVTELSSSSYYYWPDAKRKPRALDAELVTVINAVRQGHDEVYGYRKITHALKAKDMTSSVYIIWKCLRHRC